MDQTLGQPNTQPEADHYAMLGLAPGASGSDVQSAYWRLAQQYHALSGLGGRLGTTLDHLNEAAEVLGTPALRQRYDASRRLAAATLSSCASSAIGRTPSAIAKRLAVLVMAVVAAMLSLPDTAVEARGLTTVPGIAVASAPIIFFGDSITSGAGSTSDDASFAGVLEQRLVDAGVVRAGDYEVVISALGGQIVDLRFAQDIGRAPRSLVVVEIGAHSVVEDQGLSAVDFRAGYGLMLDCLQGTGARVVVSTVPTLGWDQTNPLYARAEGRSTIIRDEADRRGIPVADVWDAMKDRHDLLSQDAFHPSDAGHRMIADLFWRQIEPLLGKPAGAFRQRCDYDALLTQRSTNASRHEREGHVQ